MSSTTMRLPANLWVTMSENYETAPMSMSVNLIVGWNLPVLLGGDPSFLYDNNTIMGVGDPNLLWNGENCNGTQTTPPVGNATGPHVGTNNRVVGFGDVPIPPLPSL